MRHAAALPAALLLAACAAPYVAPTAAGRPASEVSRLVAASEAKQFPCTIQEVKHGDGAVAVAPGGGQKSEVTLAPGRYRVTLFCTSGIHSFRPQADVAARAGKGYRITGYLVDDSITIFTMKMMAKVAEIQ